MSDQESAVTTSKGWKVGVIATLVMAMLAFGVAMRNHSVAAVNIAAARDVKMFQVVEKPDLGSIQRELLLNPLEPNLLHGFVAYSVSSRGAASLSEPERRALESLGWQSTIVQTDLLQDAIARADEAAVLTRIDGLLRRGKSTQPLANLLVQIEQTGSDARDKLVTMLSNEPRWRSDFLLAPSGMTGDTAVVARFETLDLMFGRRLLPSREEVAPIINLLSASGDSVRAETLWRKFQKIGGRTPVPYDPYFRSLAANTADGEYQAMAYEWQPGEGMGYSAQASSVGDGNSILRLRWDGRGAPAFLQQKLIIPRGRFAVTVTGSLLERAAMQRVGFVFYCKGLTPVFYDRLSQGPDGEFVFTGDEAVGCDNPNLSLIGNSEADTSAVELEINSIFIRRQAAADSSYLG
jgi:hypothetical protein